MTVFATTNAFSGFTVDDLEAARAFYEGTLGIPCRAMMDGYILVLDLAGGERPTLVYPKTDHEPAGYTVLNFPVPDIETAVDALLARGVTLERYDGFTHDERGIARGDGPPIAWFCDPAGNILAVLEDTGP